MRRLRLGSLRNKLALVFFAITAAAFSVLYYFVVPQLETNLVERRLDDLERVARGARPALETLTADPRGHGRRGGPAGPGGRGRRRRAGDPPRGAVRRRRRAEGRGHQPLPDHRLARDERRFPRTGAWPPARWSLASRCAERAPSTESRWPSWPSRSPTEVGWRVWPSTPRASRTLRRPSRSSASACWWPPALALLLALVGVLPRGPGARPPRQAARGGGAGGRRGAVQGALAGGLARRARPAHA